MKFSKHLLTMIPTFALVIMLIPPSSAHVPKFEGGGNSLETATHIDNPLKSWVVYDELHESGEAHYFSVHMDEGQRLRLQFFSPEQDFVPSAAIMGPGIEVNDTIPPFVDVPDGANVLLLNGERQNKAEYEPFTPASYYYIADFDWDVTIHGDYFIAVFHTDQEGRYGMAIGYVEEFTFEEWLLVPTETIAIHEWGGQNIAAILAPLIVTLLVGSILLIWPPGNGRLTKESEIWRVLVSLAGLLFIGSGFMLATQMTLALSRSGLDAASIVTMIFVSVPLVLGYFLLKRGMNQEDGLTPRNRAILVIFGLLGLFMWAGVIIGPILLMIAAILPSSLAFGAKSEELPIESE